MAQWKKIIVSGSNAHLNEITGSKLNLSDVTHINSIKTPLVIDSDGNVFTGSEYASPAGTGTTVGGSDLLNNVAIIGSGSSTIMTASLNQDVSFNTASLHTITNITASGNISASISSTGSFGHLESTTIKGTLQTPAQTNITSVGTLTSLEVGDINSSGNITGSNISGGNITGSNISGSETLFANEYQIQQTNLAKIVDSNLVLGSTKDMIISASSLLITASGGITASIIPETIRPDFFLGQRRTGEIIKVSLNNAGSVGSSGGSLSGINSGTNINLTNTLTTSESIAIAIKVSGSTGVSSLTGSKLVQSQAFDDLSLLTGLGSNDIVKITTNLADSQSIGVTSFDNSVGGDDSLFGITLDENVTISPLQGGFTHTIFKEVITNTGNPTINLDDSISITDLTASGDISASGDILATGAISTIGNITGSNISASNNIIANQLTGTLTTATQTNITSVGTLTSLNVSNNTKLTGSTIMSGTLSQEPLLEVKGNISASQISASHGLKASGSLLFEGDADFSGSVDISGSFNFNAFNFSEIDFGTITGSTSFGSQSFHTHKFTGSVFISGSPGNVLSVVNADNTTVFAVNNAGLITGSSLLTGGNISGSIISTGSFGHLIVPGNISGTLQTEAQPNITSLGTLTSLGVGNIDSTGTLEVDGITNLGAGLNITGSTIISGTLSQEPLLEIKGNISASNITASNNILVNNILSIPSFSNVSESLSLISKSAADGAGVTGITAGTNISTNDSNGDITIDILDSVTFTSMSITNITASGNISGSVNSALIINQITSSTIKGTLDGTSTGLSGTPSITVSNIAASQISGSGHLFASVSLANATAAPTASQVVVYDTASGQFFYTGSFGAGGGGVGFPYSGSDDKTTSPGAPIAIITGSLLLSGSGHITASGNISASGDINANNILTKGNLTVGGNLTVEGTTTTINTTELHVEDRFILLGSGSYSTNTNDTDVGIIFDSGSIDGTGSALYFNHSRQRFSVASNVASNHGVGDIGNGDNATVKGNIVTVVDSSNSNIPVDEDVKYGNGELRILTNGDIYIRTN